jgi:hypothetical protein
MLPERHVDLVLSVVKPLVATKSRGNSALITNDQTLNCDRVIILLCKIADNALIVCARNVQVGVCNGRAIGKASQD